MAIQIKRGTKSAITTNNPVLLAGQPCVETDTGQMKVGNGTNNYNDLPYVGEESASAGSATQPVYFSNGKPVECTYTLGKSVPSDAVFNDFSGAVSHANGTRGLVPAPTTDDASRDAYLSATGRWQVPNNSDTKVTNTLNNSSKAYLTGTTSASTNTGTQVFDNGVYLETTAGRLHVGSLSLGSAILTYDTTKKAIKISFS